MIAGQAHNLPKVVEVAYTITLVDPPRNRIEGYVKDGVLIPIQVGKFGATFVWPQVGETWTIRRENYDWVLGSRVQGPNDTNPPVSSITPGEGYFHATAITLSDGSKVQSSSGLVIKEGPNAKQGIVILVGGTKVVPNTSVTANSRIQLTSQVDGGTPGFLRVSSKVPGVSFTIMSSSATDTSTVAYQISEPAT